MTVSYCETFWGQKCCLYPHSRSKWGKVTKNWHPCYCWGDIFATREAERKEGLSLSWCLSPGPWPWMTNTMTDRMIDRKCDVGAVSHSCNVFFKYKPKVFLKNAMLMIGRARETTRISILSQRKTTSCCMLLKWIGWRKIMTLWSSKYKISEIKSFEPNPLTCRTRKILVRLKHTRIPSSTKELNP